MQTPNLEEGEAIGGRGWYYSKERWSVPISPPYVLFLYQQSFARNFRLQFSVGVANPQFGGRGGRRVSGMVPSKERWWVSIFSNFSSIFTRFRDIAAFVLQHTTFFPTPPLVSPKFSQVPLGLGGSPFGYKERRCCANCSCN